MNNPLRYNFLKETDVAPLKSPNTQLVAAFVTCGGRLAKDPAGNPDGFRETLGVDHHGNPRRTVVWVLEDMTIDFKDAESLTTGQFLKCWNDKEWLESHTDHPVAYMKWYQTQLSNFRDQIRNGTPFLEIRKGSRIASVKSVRNEAGELVPDEQGKKLLERF